MSLVPILHDAKIRVKKQAYIQWEGGDDVIDWRYNYANWPKSNHKMLFDHQVDKQENHNCVIAEKYQKTRIELQKRLKKVKKFAFRNH